MYADMGHFGRMPIRLAWFAIAMPCLVVTYFGQGEVVTLLDETLAERKKTHELLTSIAD